jgi:hypothetical protein
MAGLLFPAKDFICRRTLLSPKRLSSGLSAFTSEFGMVSGGAHLDKTPASEILRSAEYITEIKKTLSGRLDGQFSSIPFLANLRQAVNSQFQRKRSISTPRLNTLRCLHLEPINPVIFRGPMSNLGCGFALRCFQRLSNTNLATQRFSWYQS